jgi:hypothetical protein
VARGKWRSGETEADSPRDWHSELMTSRIQSERAKWLGSGTTAEVGGSVTRWIRRETLS